MALFKIDELLLIENLTYFEETFPFTGIINSKGLTVKEFLAKVDMDKIDMEFEYATYMTGFDFKNLILATKRHHNIMDCYIAETHMDTAYGGGKGVSAVFINEKSKEAVVAFRGTALNEWVDDFVASNQIDSLQQINALEWYKQIYDKLELEKYTVTVIGHSKGGNKAKYITILNDTVNRCVSFDGQGFSDVFIEHYRDRILKRQELIENHNIDYDYVNILLNDIGNRTYYHGYDYGKGGFAEAHCPNTFFDFEEDGKYNIRINSAGQAPEMQILDQFINSMSRSDFSDKERNETAQLVGILVEKAFSIGASEENTVTDYISFVCDLVKDEKYSNNTAFLLAFVIKFSAENKAFLPALKDIMRHFGMDDFSNMIDMMGEIVLSKKLDTIVNLSNFLALHVSGVVTKIIQSVAKKKYGVELTKEQVKGLLLIVSMTKETLKTLKLNLDGSDIVLEKEIEEEAEYTLPTDLNIVVLCGGLSTQRNISIKSGILVSDALKFHDYNVILLDSFMGYGEEEEIIDNPFDNPDKYSLKIDEFTNEIPDLWAVKKRRKDQSGSYFGPNVLQICKKADVVFLALLGGDAENGKLQATFDLLDIDYTGCDYFSSAISTNKYVAKEILRSNGIPVPKGYLIKKGENITEPEEKNMSYPVVVKPCNGGIGLGVSVVMNKASFQKAIKDAYRWAQEILVEEYVSGRQFSVSTINGKALPIYESAALNTLDDKTDLALDGKIVENFNKKYSDRFVKELSNQAEKAAYCLGMKDYSMADFIIRSDGTYVCLEVDSLPEITDDSRFASSAKETGMSFDMLCVKILELALSNKGK